MNMPTSISCIGAGNVATSILSALHGKGMQVRHVISKNGASAEKLAGLVKATFAGRDLSALDDASDVYMICVKDDDIPVVLENLPFCLTGNQVLVHTSGSYDEKTLISFARLYGSFYPLQTFRKDILTDLQNTPFLVNGNTEDATRKITGLASMVSNHVKQYSFTDRQNMHVAAVIVNNFTNHLYTLAHSYCRDNQLDFNDLWPLIEEGARNARLLGPERAQTGPAIRNDYHTISKHLGILEDHPTLANIYQILTVSIQNWHHHENPERI